MCVGVSRRRIDSLTSGLDTLLRYLVPLLTQKEWQAENIALCPCQAKDGGIGDRAKWLGTIVVNMQMNVVVVSCSGSGGQHA